VDTRIAELRRALDDDAAHPSYIETIPGQGYRFMGKVETQP
jgi:DNA-binding winged helix-turn-helix (wHTH) protein